MRANHLISVLDCPTNAAPLLDSWGLDDFDRGLRNLRALHQSLGAELMLVLAPPLGQSLPGQADPDMALNNLERFFSNPQARGQVAILLEDGGRGLDVLAQLFSTSQFFS